MSEFLRHAKRNDDYVFEAADHAIIARDLGVSSPDNDVACELFLYAAEKAALSASFDLAQKYLTTAEEYIDRTKGYYIRYLSQLAQVGAVLGLHNDVFAKVCVFTALCTCS